MFNPAKFIQDENNPTGIHKLSCRGKYHVGLMHAVLQDSVFQPCRTKGYPVGYIRPVGHTCIFLQDQMFSLGFSCTCIGYPAILQDLYKILQDFLTRE